MDERKVFVGQLPWGVNKWALREAIVQAVLVVVVSSCRRRRVIVVLVVVVVAIVVVLCSSRLGSGTASWTSSSCAGARTPEACQGR